MNAPKSCHLTPELERLRPMSVPHHVGRDMEQSNADTVME